MKVHVFANRKSPAVRIHGLKRTAQVGEKDFEPDAHDFMEKKMKQLIFSK